MRIFQGMYLIVFTIVACTSNQSIQPSPPLEDSAQVNKLVKVQSIEETESALTANPNKLISEQPFIDTNSIQSKNPKYDSEETAEGLKDEDVFREASLVPFDAFAEGFELPKQDGIENDHFKMIHQGSNSSKKATEDNIKNDLRGESKREETILVGEKTPSLTVKPAPSPVVRRSNSLLSRKITPSSIEEIIASWNMKYGDMDLIIGQNSRDSEKSNPLQREDEKTDLLIEQDRERSEKAVPLEIKDEKTIQIVEQITDDSKKIVSFQIEDEERDHPQVLKIEEEQKHEISESEKSSQKPTLTEDGMVFYESPYESIRPQRETENLKRTSNNKQAQDEVTVPSSKTVVLKRDHSKQAQNDRFDSMQENTDINLPTQKNKREPETIESIATRKITLKRAGRAFDFEHIPNTIREFKKETENFIQENNKNLQKQEINKFDKPNNENQKTDKEEVVATEKNRPFQEIENQEIRSDEVQILLQETLAEKKTELPPNIKEEIRQIMLKFQASDDYEVHPEFQRQVSNWIQKYTAPNKQLFNFFQEALMLHQKYLPLIKPAFEKKGLPEELLMLALVESGFKFEVKSRAGAKGMFQFMKSTGRDYGLKIRGRHDERLHVTLSAAAGAALLSDLILTFGTGEGVLFALAAYNAGTGRIISSLKKIDDIRKRNFWMLVAKGTLKQETISYVPQIIAAIIIHNNYQFYGFRKLQLPPEKELVYIQFRQPQKVSKLIQRDQNCDKDCFYDLNPDLKDKKMTHSSKRIPYFIRIHKASISAYQIAPPKKKNVFQRQVVKYKSSPNARKKTRTRGAWKNPFMLKPVHGKKYIKFKVKQTLNRSDLVQIAQGFSTSLEQLQKDNPKLRISIKRGQISKGTAFKITRLPNDTKKEIYRVRTGDNLHKISNRYRVPISMIQLWNGLKTDKLYVNQNLVIYNRNKFSKKTPITIKKNLSGNASGFNCPQAYPYSLMYTVKSRNTIGGIAHTFKVPISKIRLWNDLKKDQISTGAHLKLCTKEQFIVRGYRVKLNDTLSKISKRFRGINARDIALTNGMSLKAPLKVNRTLEIYVIRS